MKRAVLLSAFAIVAACAPDNQPSAGAPPSQVEPPPASGNPPIDNLRGEYRVAGIDGEPIDLPVGLALSISGERIDFPVACGGFAWGYRFEGNRLATTRAASPDPACLARTTLPRTVFQLADALDAAVLAERTPSNGIVLSGAGRSVTLYSQ